jgi:hypothetical protein
VGGEVAVGSSLEDLASEVANLRPEELERLLQLVSQRLEEQYGVRFEKQANRFIEQHRTLLEELAKR